MEEEVIPKVRTRKGDNKGRRYKENIPSVTASRARRGWKSEPPGNERKQKANIGSPEL